ncbi:transmembrane protein, putative (macronuclear) [Tetrahymena thermophila SB210]|uniref:Transmembrane protein, putative n=1 Tax=Tetrahymena thermophila (strain SB210) TaxID=312017 RepID=Q23JB2_TETTS|nr:transmembrane protein, putative [Tetrahymena thermophila SB210]EAR96592.1 transmembrane protein, putative [Tetrahymena thermophila SB210]|eukprot:XP_001016837.1 transmembrane protein, putative [Tetrahymena thermophila SB210]
MVKIDPTNKWSTTKLLKETDTHVFYRDNLGKVRSFRKDTPSSKDFVRLRFMENFWRWWRFKTPDLRMALTPVALSLVSGLIIYNLSIWVSEHDVMIQERAKLPKEFTKENVEAFKKERQQKQSEVQGNTQS